MKRGTYEIPEEKESDEEEEKEKNLKFGGTKIEVNGGDKRRLLPLRSFPRHIFSLLRNSATLPLR